MADLERSVRDVIELTPVPYSTVQGAGLYGQFLDSRQWPEFMADGYVDALAALTDFAGPADGGKSAG